MKAVHRLKHAFLIALSVGVVATAQERSMAAFTSVAPKTTLFVKPVQDVQQAQFDYAFGDQIAAAMNLPGATGKNWGIKDSYEALEAFLEKNPNALKGKNVMVALGDCTFWDAIARKNKLTRKLLTAVGDGHIVVMGVSEKRTDGLGNYGNKQIKNFIADHKGVAIYGGSIMPVVKGETLDPKRDYIYPETPEEFQYAVTIANAALNAALKPVAAIKAPAVKK